MQLAKHASIFGVVCLLWKYLQEVGGFFFAHNLAK